MKLTSQSFFDGGAIPGRCAFAVIDAVEHLKLSQNLNPELSWTQVPDGTRSFALLGIDHDAPSQPDDVNQEGRSVAAELPRVEFVHWAMIDIPADTCGIAEGACSEGVTPKGKQTPVGPDGSRQGLNDYTSWFDGDADMAGRYKGYDGPCPPWNDERPHHYHFELLALDVATLPVDGEFTAADVRAAADGHVLGSAKIVGLYTLNPAVRIS